MDKSVLRWWKATMTYTSESGHERTILGRFLCSGRTEAEAKAQHYMANEGHANYSFVVEESDLVGTAGRDHAIDTHTGEINTIKPEPKGEVVPEKPVVELRKHFYLYPLRITTKPYTYKVEEGGI